MGPIAHTTHEMQSQSWSGQTQGKHIQISGAPGLRGSRWVTFKTIMGSAGFIARLWKWLAHLLSPSSYQSPHKNIQSVPKPGQNQERFHVPESHQRSELQHSKIHPLLFPKKCKREINHNAAHSAKTHTAILSRLKQFQRKDQKSLGQPN